MSKTGSRTNLYFWGIWPLLYIFLYHPFPSYSQYPVLRFESIGKIHGLSQVTINDIYQDRYGFLWLATQEGLNRYDGYEFRVYKNNPSDSTSLSHSWTWHIQEDTLGYLWVGCWIGLNRYDPKTEQIVRFFNDPDDPQSLAGSRINYIERDLSGRIWISCWGAGLSLLKDVRGKFQTIGINSPSMDTVSYIRCLTPSVDGGLWVGSWGKGIWKIREDRTGHFNAKPVMPDHPQLTDARITTLFEKEGKLFIATEGQGTWIYFMDDQKVVNVNHFIKNRSLPDDIYRIALFEDQLLLASMIDGLWMLDTEKGIAHQYLHDPQDPGSLNSNTIYSMYVDHHGTLWLGTQGINKYDPAKNKFAWYHHVRNDTSTLSQDDVFSFCEDDRGQIWIGKRDHLLTRFDPDSKKMVHFPLSDERHQVKLVTSINYQEPWLWIGTEGHGLVKYNPKDQTIHFLMDRSRVLDRITRITCMEWLHPDTLMIGTDGQGLVKYIPSQDAAKIYRFNRNDPHTIGYDVVNCLLKDKQGRFWLGTWGGGLNLYVAGEDHFMRYYYRSDFPNTLSSDIVYDMLDDPAGNLWIATANGLNHYDHSQQIFHHFYESDGLPGNMINKLLWDPLGNLWLSTNYGVSQFNLQDSIFINYTPSEGLQGYEFNSGVGMASSHGLFYFGGTQGFNEFDPVSIQEHLPGGPVVFTSIQVFQKPLQGMDYNDPELSLRLPHHQDFLSFEFAALNYAGDDLNRYAYRMNGLEEDWVFSGKRRYANYTDLDPGDYIFEVALARGIHVAEETIRSIPIRILPPFWQTGWFITMSIFVFFLLLYAIHRYRISRVIALANLRNKIATDLHDDVGSSLTKISIYSGMLQTNPDPESSKTYLDKISSLSREVIGTMSDIVWSIDTRKDEWYNLTDRMQDFIWEIGSLKNIEVDFRHDHLPENQKMNLILRQNLYLIFKEAVNNAAKYAEASRIEIQLQIRDHQVELKISDNGKGFDLSEAKGNGLINMKRRAERIGGKFSIQTDRGTAIRLIIPFH
jgi:ligand-binding sensor domain-containing protein/signal transduction histidine kinase